MKSLGLASLIFFGVAVSYMLTRWSGDTALTFSQNAARSRASIIYYGAILAVFLTMLSFFAFGWFIPTFQLPVAFSAVFAIGVAGQMVAGFVPETRGWRKTTHIAASSVMYVATLILVGILAFHSSTPFAGRVVSTFALVIMVAVILAALLSQRSHKYAVALQTTHMLCFYAALLSVTYLV